MAEKTSCETEAYIVAHMNDEGLSRAALARQAHVSVSTLYRIIREHGGRIDHNRSMKLDGIEQKVRELYPSMSARDVARRIGRTKSTVIRWAERLGVRHTEAFEEQCRRIQQENMERSHTGEVRMRARDTWRRRRIYDRVRNDSGLSQLTKFRFAVVPGRVRQAMWHLADRHNYFYETPVKSATLYYDEETVRSKKEEYYIKKHGIKFIEA